MTRYTITINDAASGHSSTELIPVDIVVPASTTVTRTLTHFVEVSSDRLPALKSARWRLTGAGADESGRACDMSAVDASVVFPEPAGGGPAPALDEVILAAGDIAKCGSPMQEATAKILDRFSGPVLALGDLAYHSGTADEFRNCYEPSWGRHKRRTYPAPGNHDWDATGGGPYFDYFGGNAGPPGLGYYTYTLGAWRVLSLNSNIDAGSGSAQHAFVKATLAGSRNDCVLAYWHHPVFSSGLNGSSDRMKAIWKLLSDAGADLILQAHDHLYERFAPQDADGNSQNGVRSFVVGTGGFDLYEIRSIRRNSQLIENRTWGVLKVTLKSSSYDWDFLPIAGQNFTDLGSQVCTPAH